MVRLIAAAAAAVLAGCVSAPGPVAEAGAPQGPAAGIAGFGIDLYTELAGSEDG